MTASTRISIIQHDMGSDLYLIIQKNITTSIPLIFLFTLVFASGCKSVIQRQEDIRPRVLRDVPARVLAYRFEPDVTAPNLNLEETEKVATVNNDFTTRRTDDALIRTVVSPDGQRILALYGTDAEPGPTFRIDLYNKDGQFIKNLIPPDLSCVFPETVTWSPDGNFINFIAHKRVMPTPTPPPLGAATPENPPVATPSLAPSFALVQGFLTEQIYICNRDGYDLRPLTAREGLIYFHFAWAPDNHAIVALACKEDEWTAREKQFKSPAGRPRLITPDGKERLLDDGLADALPVWSTDSSKVATAFEFDVAIYDAVATDKPTQARLPLRDQLLAASVIYEQKASKKSEAGSEKPAGSPTPQATAGSSTPASFNPITRLEWTSPERLFFQTAFIRLMPTEAITTFQRWHVLHLSAQAAVLK